MRELESQGDFHSAGQFTISPEKALEKLASFSLPLPESWVLCLVQFAVGAGAKSIELRLNAGFIQFQADIEPTWTFPEFEKRLHELPKDLPQELEALLLALWQTSFAQGRSVLYSPPSGKAYLMKAGAIIEKKSVGPNFSVEVSHRTSDSEPSNPAELNADVLTLLTDRAFVCPVALKVDGRRLDTLLEHSQASLLNLYQVDCELPKFPVPRLGSPNTLTRTLEFKRRSPLQWDGDFLVSGFCVNYLAQPYQDYSNNNQPASLRLGADKSLVYWISDGVVVDTGTITLPQSGFVLHLFLSAEGLAKDMSGQLIRDNVYKERRRRALTVASAELAQRYHNFRFPSKEEQQSRKFFFGLLTLRMTSALEFSDAILRDFENLVDKAYGRLRDSLQDSYRQESS